MTLSRFKSLILDQDGGMTVFMIFWMIIFFIFGGIAVDSSNAWRMRAELQATVDAAAHAAVLDIENQAIALSTANEYAEANMPSAMHGDVLVDTDVVFGNWFDDVFTPQEEFDEDAPLEINAVRATVYRAANNNNRLPAYFLRLAGFQSWNISAQAIAAYHYKGTCDEYENVIMSGGRLRLLPGSEYGGNLCLHSWDYIRSQPGTAWTNGVYASMPDEAFDNNVYEAWDHYNPQAKVQQDEDGNYFIKDNEGLYGSLHGDNDVPMLTDDLPAMTSSVYYNDTTYMPSKFNEEGASAPTVQYVNLAENGQPETWLPDTMYHVDCGNLEGSITDLTAAMDAPGGFGVGGYDFAAIAERLFAGMFAAHAQGQGNSQLTIEADLNSVIIVTDCAMNIKSGVYIDSMFVTTYGGPNNALDFVNNPAAQFGADDNCEPGGDTRFLVPNGDIHAAADTSFYDVVMLGGGDLEFAAGQGGDSKAVGLNIQVAGTADIRALANFIGCGTPPDQISGNYIYALVQ